MNKLVILAAFLLLAACSPQGALYSEAKPDPKTATVIIYRPDRVFGAATYFYIDINGTKACSLAKGGYFTRHTPDSKMTISSSMFSVPGTSRTTLNLQRNHVYYLRMELNGAKQMGGAIGGMVGALVAEGVSDTAGPYLFTLIDEQQAKQELQGLRLEEGCL